LSFTPSGAEFEWRTTGPVDYAELYVSPKTIEAFWGEVPDVPHSTLLQDRLGAVEPLVEALFKAMLDELGRGDDASCLHLDTLFASLWCAWVDSAAMAVARSARTRGARSPHPGFGAC